MVYETTDAKFEADVLNSDKTTVVDFWAPWCGPCRMVSPILEEVSNEVSDGVQVYKLNVDENPVTASKYGITGIPTVIVFKDGKIKETMVGVRGKDAYLAAVK